MMIGFFITFIRGKYCNPTSNLLKIDSITLKIDSLNFNEFPEGMASQISLCEASDFIFVYGGIDKINLKYIGGTYLISKTSLSIYKKQSGFDFYGATLAYYDGKVYPFGGICSDRITKIASILDFRDGRGASINDLPLPSGSRHHLC